MKYYVGLAFALLIVGFVVWLEVKSWNECLETNSWFYCMRILGK